MLIVFKNNYKYLKANFILEITEKSRWFQFMPKIDLSFILFRVTNKILLFRVLFTVQAWDSPYIPGESHTKNN